MSLMPRRMLERLIELVSYCVVSLIEREKERDGLDFSIFPIEFVSVHLSFGRDF